MRSTTPDIPEIGQSSLTSQVNFWLPAPSNHQLSCASFGRAWVPPHLHEEWQFAVNDDTGWLSVGAFRRYAVGSTEIAVVHPYEVHTEVPPQGGSRGWRVLYVSRQLLTELFNGLFGRSEVVTPWFVRPVLSDPVRAAELVALLAESERGTVGADDFVRRVRSWLTEVLRLHAASTTGSERPRDGARSVQQVRACLEAGIFRPLPLEQVAAQVGVTPSHMIRSFSRSVGLPPMSYQAQVRLARARRLLTEGRSASWVAHECGFTDQSHMSRRFKLYFGVTPGAFQAHLLEHGPVDAMVTPEVA